MSQGPLAVRFGAAPQLTVQAGAVTIARVEVENAGSVAWRDGIGVAYHWLDRRDNPIVWDGRRTPAPPLAPGERALVELHLRGPIPPGPYRLAFDVVAEHRAWFSELGSEMLSIDLDVAPPVFAIRDAIWSGHLPRGWDVLYLAVAALVSLVLGALVFRSVDDRIAVEL